MTIVPADLILTSNTVFTGFNDLPEPASIVIRGNRIVDILAVNMAESFIGPNTKVLHFKDQLIMPGFHDFPSASH
ncbi:UNVERIFIED_CONTAM: putative amidohydrolase YtcJ [Brevibacillus sp. OAP136]